MANSPPIIPTVIRVAIPLPLNKLFDYLLPDDAGDIAIGCRVIVPFGPAKKVGYVTSIVNNSDIDLDRLKPLIKILDPLPLLNCKDLELIHWASRYYHYPLGEVFNAAFPVSLRKGKPATLPEEKYYTLSAKGELLKSEQLNKTPKQKLVFQWLQAGDLTIPELKQRDKNWRPACKALLEKQLIDLQLRPKQATKHSNKVESAYQPNEQQTSAINQITQNLSAFSVTLLEGVTGSGKTEVYMHVIQQVLDQDKQVLVLLPEISLTPQLESRFKNRFSQALASSHSKLTETQRHNAWLEMQLGLGSIMLGTRSALFTPLKTPGLIILDEEHDASFKQQEGFRFSARDLAIVKAKLLNIPIILGTATPSLESFYNAENKRYQLLHLSERAGVAVKPKFLLFDIRNQILQDGLSEPLIKQINRTLEKNEQVLLFLNRRGFAPVQICQSCAWVSRCRHCDTSLVIHFDEKRLRCHHCGFQQQLIHNCPACKNGELKPLGLGTERVEKKLKDLFPNQRIVRLDRDTTQRKGSLQNHLEQINQGNIDIILGTQMLAKGHHFPNVTLVAILDVDSGLFSIDFHATERLAQLIIQVAGRAGRAEKPGKVILQTRQPDHPLLTVLLKDGYRAFAKTALAERNQASLPPYSYQALLRVYAENPAAPQVFLKIICQLISKDQDFGTTVLGPVSAPMTKRAGNFHFQLLLQNNQRKKLQALLESLIPQFYTLKEANKVRWSIDVDPVDLY